MAKQVTGSVAESSAMAAYATPEVRGLFEEWARVVEEEILALVGEKGSVAPDAIAAQLKISAESALFFIGRLARAGKLVIGEVRSGQPAARSGKRER